VVRVRWRRVVVPVVADVDTHAGSGSRSAGIVGRSRADVGGRGHGSVMGMPTHNRVEGIGVHRHVVCGRGHGRIAGLTIHRLVVGVAGRDSS
jgi:hypothetical protein